MARWMAWLQGGSSLNRILKAGLDFLVLEGAVPGGHD